MVDLFNKLDEKAPIYEELRKYPDWWTKFKSHPCLYIEVRKNNTVDVYYEGGKVAGVRYNTRLKKLELRTHYKYLGLQASKPTYVECTDTIGDRLDTTLEFIRKEYSWRRSLASRRPKAKEVWSEKYIQGELILNNRGIHLDSEFAYTVDGKGVRIDLVKVVDGVITFVELKTISDGRLNHWEKEPEIIEKMRQYESFIEKYQNEILAYYQLVYKIKKSLHLPVPYTTPTKVNTKPELLIFNLYEKPTARRSHRLRKIQEMLYKEGITYKIIRDIKYSDFSCKERSRQVRLLGTETLDGAQGGGGWETKGKPIPLPFILKAEDRLKNLYAPIREDALAYFERYGIKWWPAEEQKENVPTGHLLSSQIHCLNHLFALRQDPEALLALIKPLGEEAGVCFNKVLPSFIDTKEEAPSYISFEFVCENKSLLNERGNTRGANCTSVDALVYAQAADGSRWLVPIEWKYTEAYAYDPRDVHSFSRYDGMVESGSRLKEWGYPFWTNPFYELGRQTLLMEKLIANKPMVEGGPLQADHFLHVIVIPKGNKEMNDDATTFIDCVKEEQRKYVRIIDPEELLSPLKLLGDKYEGLLSYLRERYYKTSKIVWRKRLGKE